MRPVIFAVAFALLQGAAPASAALANVTAEEGTGFLDVSSDPPAKIIIDDADTGKVTPQPHLALKAGHHRLTLVTLDGAHKRTLGFTLEAGETRKFTIHLSGSQEAARAAP
jgi:hypothetical protein